MEFQDYYATLGISKTATDKEVKAAYRAKAREYHPDLNPNDPGAVENFKLVTEANEVLSDPEKRHAYDELGEHWRDYEQWKKAAEAAGHTATIEDFRRGLRQERQAGQRRTASTDTGGYGNYSQEDLDDLFGGGSPFSDFFHSSFGGAQGGRRQPSGPRPGADYEYGIDVTLAESYRGATKSISYALQGSPPRTLEITIPAGVTDGSRIRLSGQGGPGSNGGKPGNLYLVVSMVPDSSFTREGDDLRVKVTASLADFLLGGDVQVPTPDGRKLALTIPAGTPDGRVFRLRGQGMAQFGKPSQKGDLFAEAHVALPEKLTPRQRELIEEYRAEEGTVQR